MRLLKNTNIKFMSFTKITAIFSVLCIIIGIISLIIKGGPLLSIDFTGGTIVQIRLTQFENVTNIRDKLSNYGFANAEIIEFGSPEEILIKAQSIGSSSDISEKLNSALGETFVLRRIESVGPKIGKELQRDAYFAIALALIMILMYIAIRFDSYYALGSVVALIHDIIITLGIFSLLNLEINLSIIAAFLTIVGYSLNDTIVIFDRIRENVSKHLKKTLDEVVDISLNNTLSRTFITSLTTLLVLTILYLWGGEVINLFAFALIIGVGIGTYSSIFVASPVMLYFEKKAKNKLHST
tara:strand:- start:1288 stop:2178 length:891 start_codon:yes stop_codon:yes gene_type:complete